MKKAKIYDKEKFDWAVDSAFDALGSWDKAKFMKRVTDIQSVSDMSKTDVLYMFVQSAYETSIRTSFIYGGHK